MSVRGFEICEFRLPEYYFEDDSPDIWESVRLDADSERFLEIYDGINGRVYDGDKIQSKRVEILMETLRYDDLHTAWDGDKIAGVSASCLDYDQGELWVAGLSVDEDYQGLGLGALLLENMERQATREGMAKVALRSVFSAEGFYERQGYHPTDQVGLDLGLVRYEKKLN